MDKLDLLRALYLSLDVFGKKARFTIKKQKTYRTLIGATISLIAFFFIIFFVWYFGQEIYLREQPHLVVTESNENDPKTMNLSAQNFEFTIGLQNPDYSLFIDESIYTIKANLVTIIRRGDGHTTTTLKEIPLIICSEYNFTIIPGYFINMDLENLYCFKDPNDLFVEGDFGQPLWQYIEFNFKECINSTENNNICLPEDYIHYKLSGGYLGIFAIDLSIIPNNYSHPENIFGRNIFSSFSIFDYRDFWIYLKTIKINTDEGWIFNSWKEKRFFGYDQLTQTNDFRQSDSFITVKLRTSTVAHTYDRSYMKIQTLAALVGGIIKFALMIAEIIVFWFREILFKHYILSFYNDDKANSSKLFVQLNIISKYMISKTKSHILPKQIIKSPEKINYQIPNSNAELSQMSLMRNIFNNYSFSSKKKDLKKEFSSKKISGALLSLCFCKHRIRRELKNMLMHFNNIAINFEFIHYLKSLNDLYILKLNILNEQQMKLNEIGYNFEQKSLLNVSIYFT